MLLKKVCTYNVSSVQCVYVYMCVCACSYVCIILALTRVKGLGMKVGCIHFIKVTVHSLISRRARTFISIQNIGP